MVLSDLAVERVRIFSPDARSLKTTGPYCGWISAFIAIHLYCLWPLDFASSYLLGNCARIQGSVKKPRYTDSPSYRKLPEPRNRLSVAPSTSARRQSH